MLNPLEHPVCLEFPAWLEETAWAEHIPFGMFAISVLRPKVFVELGAFWGVSYCAICQAVNALGIETKCYAIDTWAGDAQAGILEDDVLIKLRDYHDPLYSNFSNLVQSTFDDALRNFVDGSIDLLHIDGFHSYEAVRHDFETWLPKMSENGIVLFHDTNVPEFGVRKFWAEIKKKFPHFEFLHGHGLGVLAVGAKGSEKMQFLFSADENETAIIRDYFHQMGSRIETIRTLRSRQKHIENMEAYIESLEPYEQLFRNSRMMRVYRVLKMEGVGNLIKKGSRIGRND